MDTLHIIIADKSQLLRLGMAGIIHQTGFSVQIHEISDYSRFFGALQKESFQLAFISDKFLGQCGHETLKLLKERKKYLKLVLIRSESDQINAGIYFCETIDDNDPEKVILKKTIKLLDGIIKDSHDFSGTEEISAREKEVLQLVAKGLTNKEIAEKLFISTHTVITHRKNITAKLGIKTIAGLTVYAVINKLIPIEDIK